MESNGRQIDPTGSRGHEVSDQGWKKFRPQTLTTVAPNAGAWDSGWKEVVNGSQDCADTVVPPGVWVYPSRAHASSLPGVMSGVGAIAETVGNRDHEVSDQGWEKSRPKTLTTVAPRAGTWNAICEVGCKLAAKC